MSYEYRATIARIVDADTVDMTVDLGFRVQKKDRFRLAGINAPERGQEGWSEANAALAAMIPIGSVVAIQTKHPTARDPADKYGRWLASIYFNGISINQVMLDQGHAVEYVR